MWQFICNIKRNILASTASITHRLPQSIKFLIIAAILHCLSIFGDLHTIIGNSGKLAAVGRKK